MNKEQIKSELYGLINGLSKEYFAKDDTIIIKGVKGFEPKQGVYVWIKDCFDELNVFEIQKDYDEKTYRYFVGDGGMTLDDFVEIIFDL